MVVISGTVEGEPIGLAIGSFTSLSLDPPLVLFCVDKDSRSWPAIAEGGVFCVNVLADDQAALARRFATRGTDRFDGVGRWLAPSGSPILEQALAWIDCAIERVDEGGDHWIVIGRVTGLSVEREAQPLVFFRGRYGSCRP